MEVRIREELRDRAALLQHLDLGAVVHRDAGGLATAGLGVLQQRDRECPCEIAIDPAAMPTHDAKDAAHDRGAAPYTRRRACGYSAPRVASDGRARLWLRALAPAAILVGGWLIFISFAYPGLMSIDSFDQLGEARAWFFTDSHPPAMAALWGLVDRIVSGPFGMLALQTGCFLAGV